MRFFSPPPTSQTPREERARRATEAVLAAGLVASLLACLFRGPDPPPTPPLHDLEIDLAHDPPWLLRLLPSIGPAKARAIVADRERNGPLPSLDVLRRVRGFGPKSIVALEKAGATITRPSAIPAAGPGPPLTPPPLEPSPDPPEAQPSTDPRERR